MIASKITKYSITALLLLSLLITTTAHAYAPVASAVARALATNKQLRNLAIGSGLLVGGGGTVLNDIFGGDYNPDTPAPPPPDNGASSVWITNGLVGSRAMSPQGSCNLLNEGHGVKLTFENGYRCTVYSPNLGGGSITYNTYKTVGDLWENPKLTDIANDIVNQAKNGNKTALDIIRASEPPAPFDIDNATNDDLINWLNNNNADSSDDSNNSSSDNSSSNTSDTSSSNSSNASNNAGTSNNSSQQNPPNNSNGGVGNFELPKFCEWAVVVCNFVDWADNEYKPQLQDSKLDVQELELDEQKTKKKIDFDSYCPSPDNFTVSYNKVSKNLKISYKNHCEFFIKLKPFLIGIAGLISLMIISGRLI